MTVLFFPGLLKGLFFFFLGLTGHGRSANFFFLPASSPGSRTHARAYSRVHYLRSSGATARYTVRVNKSLSPHRPASASRLALAACFVSPHRRDTAAEAGFKV